MRTWHNIIVEMVERTPAGGFLVVFKDEVGSPMAEGAERSIGLFRGQVADFRWTLADCRGVHAQEFDDYYEIHLDQIAPACDPIGHLQADAPVAFLLVAALAGGAAASAVFGLKAALPGCVAGAVLGALVPKPPPGGNGSRQGSRPSDSSYMTS